MKLIEALRIASGNHLTTLPDMRVFLACGFSPLHLETFLKAHLQLRLQEECVKLDVGVFGDLVGNVQRAVERQLDSAAVVIEWPDLDARLSIRESGSWGPSAFSDIAKSVRSNLEQLESGLTRLVEVCPVSLCLPTLPFPPVSHTTNWEVGSFELEVRAAVAGMAFRCSNYLRVLNAQQLGSALPTRLDLRSEFKYGHPYEITHCDHLANHLAALIAPSTPKKGIVTDLDNTLWNGVLGECGVNGVSWDLNDGSRIHAVYQRVLSALSECGVLVAIASKNDPQLVAAALRREDLLISPSQVFPIEANWGVKSESVSRILDQWNISASSVVFIDDSLMEIAEVRSVHADIEGLHFERKDPESILRLIRRLRNLFGKSVLQEEDRIRIDSIRTAAGNWNSASVQPTGPEDFLSTAEAVISVDFGKPFRDARPLELINKTNQFNLNNRRIAVAEWHRFLRKEDTFVMTVSYKDKFGPLGKIAVLAGEIKPKGLMVQTWVMSCRAFTRQIEYQSLRVAFQHFNTSEIRLAYKPSNRNGPFRDFLRSLISIEDGDDALTLTAECFESHCPPLFHDVKLKATDAS